MGFFAAIVLLLCSLAFANPSTIPKVAHKPSFAQLPSLLNRVKLNVTARAEQQPSLPCDTFHISYQDVERTYRALESTVSTADAQEEQCKDGCDWEIFEACWDGCEQSRLDALHAEFARHEHGPLVISIVMLGLQEIAQFECLPYFKDSTVGNCYVHEYLVLNYKTDSGVTFDRERLTSSDGKYFQCRANALASDGDHPNQYDCRHVFHTSRARISQVSQFMDPFAVNAGLISSECYSRIQPSPYMGIEAQICYNEFMYNIQLAYSQCLLHLDSNDCILHGLKNGVPSLICPGFRRESTIDECSVVDYIDLHQMNAAEYNENGVEVFSIPNACS